METSQYLAAVRADGGSLSGLATDLLAEQVPPCPKWNVGQLLGHLGWVYRMVVGALANPGSEAFDPRSVDRPPKDDTVGAWYDASFEAVCEALDRLDPAATYWTFVGPRDGVWWARRMAHETAVHRWDADCALGRARPIARDLAIDGVEEALEVMLPGRFDHERFGSGSATVHLHATDGEGGEWMIRVGPDAASTSWERGHAKGDVAVRGSASDLLLYLYGRVAPADLDVVGDAELAGRFQDAASF